MSNLIKKSWSDSNCTGVSCRSIVVIIITCGHVWTCPNLFRIFAWAVDGLRDLKRIESSLGRRVYARWPLVWPHFYRTLSHIITCLPLCPKPSTIPLKKYFKSCGQLSKSCQKLQNSDFQSKFSMSKIIRICLNYFFIEEYHFMSILFVIDILWQFPFWNHFIFQIDVKFLMTFTQGTARLKNFLIGWLLVLSLKEGQVEPATLCIKSEVILVAVAQTPKCTRACRSRFQSYRAAPRRCKSKEISLTVFFSCHLMKFIFCLGLSGDFINVTYFTINIFKVLSFRGWCDKKNAWDKQKQTNMIKHA